MSLTYTVTVTCDGCGEWEHTDDGFGDTRRGARDRKRRGWVIKWRNEDGRRWDRRDYCPKCASRHAKTKPAEESNHGEG